MKKSWKETIGMVTQKADQLLKDRQINEGVGEIDYAAIFPKDDEEHVLLKKELNTVGTPIKITQTGTVFQLREALQTPQSQIPRVRIRIYDADKSQRGYVDYKVDDYERFKNRYLASGELSITHSRDGVEMLVVENEEVIVYFPEIPLGKSLQDNKKV